MQISFTPPGALVQKEAQARTSCAPVKITRSGRTDATKAAISAGARSAL
jgi:hypothetical protein